MVKSAILLLLVGFGLGLFRLATIIVDQRQASTARPYPAFLIELAVIVAGIFGLVVGAVFLADHACVAIRRGGLVGSCERADGLLD